MLMLQRFFSFSFVTKVSHVTFKKCDKLHIYTIMYIWKAIVHNKLKLMSLVSVFFVSFFRLLPKN